MSATDIHIVHSKSGTCPGCGNSTNAPCPPGRNSEEQQVGSCPKCSGHYHLSCWKALGGCGVHGCAAYKDASARLSNIHTVGLVAPKPLLERRIGGPYLIGACAGAIASAVVFGVIGLLSFATCTRLVTRTPVATPSSPQSIPGTAIGTEIIAQPLTVPPTTLTWTRVPPTNTPTVTSSPTVTRSPSPSPSPMPSVSPAPTVASVPLRPSGYFYVLNRHSQKCLTERGTNSPLMQETCRTGRNDQLWYLPTNNRQFAVETMNNVCVGYDPSNRSNTLFGVGCSGYTPWTLIALGIYDEVGRWSIGLPHGHPTTAPLDDNARGVYFQLQYENDCFDLNGWDHADGVLIIHTECGRTDNQIWTRW